MKRDQTNKRRRGAPIGNTNAKGHGAPHGNQYAVKGSAPTTPKTLRMTPEALVDLAAARSLSEARSDADTIAEALRRHRRALERAAKRANT